MEQMIEYSLFSKYLLAPASVFVSFIGVLICASLFSHGTRATGSVKVLLLTTSGIVGGTTLWVTNLMWLIKASANFDHHYDISSTFISLAVGICGACAAFIIASLQRTVTCRAVGGVVFGTVAFVMHYVNLFALDIVDIQSFPIQTVITILIVAISISAISFSWSVAITSYFPKLVSSVIASVGLLILHQIGFSRLNFIPLNALQSLEGLDDDTLITFILVFSCMALSLGASTFLLFNLGRLDRIKENESQLSVDPLTGVPNRANLSTRLSKVLAENDRKLALLSFDFSRFKTINDVHGRVAGDHVLQFLTTKVKSALRKNETLFRVGGDEFVVLKENLANAHEALEFARRIRDVAVCDINWEGKLLSVGISLGIAVSPDDGNQAEELIAKANLAMSRAKTENLGAPVFYDPDKDDQKLERSALSIDLHNAINNGEFKLYYNGKTTFWTEVLLVTRFYSAGFIQSTALSARKCLSHRGAKRTHYRHWRMGSTDGLL